MSGQQFTFPPPPPAPPQAPQSYPAYSQPPQGHNAYRGRGNRRASGYQGQGRGNSGRGLRGGNYGSSPAYGVNPVGGNIQTGLRNGGYNTQGANHMNEGYPLPNYPAVQFPQYPAYIGQDIRRQSSNVTTHDAGPRPSQAGCPPYAQSSPQYYIGQQSYPPNGHSLPVPNEPIAQGFQNSSSVPHNSNGPVNKPAPMGPPIRMGFDEDRHKRQPLSLPHLMASGAMSSQNGLPNGNGSPYRHDPAMSVPQARHGSPNSFVGHRGRGQKRGHREAFGRPRNHNSRPQAAPAVPSFGGALPLPLKPPSSQDHSRKPRKKKRKHNQLGLTPKTEEHESSEEEEDDADEESRLATVSAGSYIGSRLLRFEYNGQTSTLQSSSDIASWIEERRKRYPTKARAAEAGERKRRWDEAQEAARQARRETQEKPRAETKEIQGQKAEMEQKGKHQKESSEDTAARAKRKVEKLRKQLGKEEKRAAKAEARVAKQKKADLADRGEKQAAPEEYGSKKRKRTNSDGSQTTRLVELSRAGTVQTGLAIIANDNENVSNAVLHSLDNINEISKDESMMNDPQKEVKADCNPAQDPLTPMSQPPALGEVLEPQNPSSDISNTPDIVDGGRKWTVAKNIDQVTQDSSVPKTNTSSEFDSTDSEDFTSSSGSSSSDSDGDSDSDSGAPDQASLRRGGPNRVPPPKRIKSRNICREFLKSGRCKRGDNCQYRHELPQRGSRNVGRKEYKKTQGRTERVGLHQRVSPRSQPARYDHMVND